MCLFEIVIFEVECLGSQNLKSDTFITIKKKNEATIPDKINIHNKHLKSLMSRLEEVLILIFQVWSAFI